MDFSSCTSSQHVRHGMDRTDIADDLNYSYLEQSLIQISKLREILIKEATERDRHHPRMWLRHRLFRHNIFEDYDAYEKQRSEIALCNSLKSIGQQLHNNLDPTKRVKPFLVVDINNKKNIIYDNFGVMYLKAKEQIKYMGSSAKKQALMLHVTAKILTLLQNDRYMTNRELYYKTGEVCQLKPGKLSVVLNELCCLLGCSRIHLHILCQPKGIVYGDLTWKLKTGEVIDCSSDRGGVTLPTPLTPIVSITSNAKFIIVIEKDSVLQKILSQEPTTNFVKRYKAILFTARGYPDFNSRAFISLLWSKLKIPIFALADADPHGLEIVCCYKFGCYATVSEAQLTAVPHIRWLGLLPSDVKQHSLPDSSTVPLTINDKKKIESLLKRPYLIKKADWIAQIRILLDELKRKAELESIDISGEYLVRTYLPNKLRYASWL